MKSSSVGTLLVLLLDGAVAWASLVQVTHQALSSVPYFAENLPQGSSSINGDPAPPSRSAQFPALGSTPEEPGEELDDEILLRCFVGDLRHRKEIQGDTMTSLAFAAIDNSEDWRNDLESALGVAPIVMLYRREHGDLDVESVSSALHSHHYSLVFMIEETLQDGERSFILHRRRSLESSYTAPRLCQWRVLIYFESSLVASVDDYHVNVTDTEPVLADLGADQAAAQPGESEVKDSASSSNHHSNIDDHLGAIEETLNEDSQNQLGASNFSGQETIHDDDEDSSHELEILPELSNENQQAAFSNELSSQSDDTSMEGPFPNGPADSPYVPPPPTRAVHQGLCRIRRRLVFDDAEVSQDTITQSPPANVGIEPASSATSQSPTTPRPLSQQRPPIDPRRALRFDGHDEDGEFSEIQYSDSDSEGIASLAAPLSLNVASSQSTTQENDRAPGRTRQVRIYNGDLVVVVTNDTTGVMEGVIRRSLDVIVGTRLPESANQEEANEIGLRSGDAAHWSTPILYFCAIPVVSVLFLWSLWNLAKTFI